jgi:hypothetical protein
MVVDFNATTNKLIHGNRMLYMAGGHNLILEEVYSERT